MPTLSDIAKLAGVGVMSVSRVVNGTRKVSPEIERKVRAVIDRIGYEPDEAARILKGYRPKVIGLIVPDLADPFFALCANVVQEAAWEAGYMTLMAASAHREDLETQLTEVMVQRKAAGILVIPSGKQNAHFISAQNAGAKVVSFDRPLEGVDCDSLVVNNREAAQMATEHLIQHGHKQVACFADDETNYAKLERVTGYMQAMREHGLVPRVSLVGKSTGTLSEQLSLALDSGSQPTAIFAASNLIGKELLHNLYAHNIDIPGDIAMICFDDFDAATLVRPTITVVQQPTVEIAHQAARILLKRLHGEGENEPFRQIVLQTELVIRESCGCTPSGNVRARARSRKRAPGSH